MGSIFFLIFISLFLVFVICLSFFTKKIISKQTAWFSIPLIIYMFSIYLYGCVQSIDTITVSVIFDCLSATLKAFAFEVKDYLVAPLLEKDIIYSISLYIGVACSSLTLLFTTLELIKAVFKNDINKAVRLLKSKTNIVLGYNEDAFKYCKNDKSSILWIDASKIKLSREEKFKLFEEGIVYIYTPFNSRKLMKTASLITQKIVLICFQKDSEYLPSILQTLETLPNTNKTIEFHIQANGEFLPFINEQLSKRCQNKENISASVFDYYELIGRQFSIKHNLIKYLPEDYVKDGVITDDKNINIVMLGFGKTAKSLLKSIILNNQFVQIVDGKYQCKKINIDLYDINDKAFDDEMIIKLKNFDKLCENNCFDFDTEMGPMELTVNVNTKSCNIKTELSNEFLSSLKKDSNNFTYYFCSLTASIDNSLIAEKLSKIVNKESSIIFYNIDEKSERFITDSSICIPFGYKNNILSYKNIVLEDFSLLAKANNDSYNEKSLQNNSFSKISMIEKLSNIYSELNTRFKLNLIGLDYTKNKEELGLTKEEFEKYFDIKNYYCCMDTLIEEGCTLIEAEEKKYKEYFKINLANALIYQEHLRWCMFYFLYNFKGMKLSELKYKDNKIIHKDIKCKKHACLTSFYGLDILHHYELEMYLQNNINKKLSQIETYQYDLKLDTVYDELTSLGYKIVKLNNKKR